MYVMNISEYLLRCVASAMSLEHAVTALVSSEHQHWKFTMCDGQEALPLSGAAAAQALSGQTREEVEKEVTGMRWGAFKPLLADAAVAHLSPIQLRYEEIMQDKAYLHQVLREGAEAADEVASQTLSWAKDAMGFCSLKDIQP
eukprot:TRINITY_DN1796_c0_g1_i1.p1 TRINITY_DN1796_c0_g1~~TRINITY_DN1796_c0_g1_i1.p1  ORF type:complete len:143 (+),score=22.70 TRINITY_DN1796_c0_g1_i1:454-882(+)